MMRAAMLWLWPARRPLRRSSVPAEGGGGDASWRPTVAGRKGYQVLDRARPELALFQRRAGVATRRGGRPWRAARVIRCSIVPGRSWAAPRRSGRTALGPLHGDVADGETCRWPARRGHRRAAPRRSGRTALGPLHGDVADGETCRWPARRGHRVDTSAGGGPGSRPSGRTPPWSRPPWPAPNSPVMIVDTSAGGGPGSRPSGRTPPWSRPPWPAPNSPVMGRSQGSLCVLSTWGRRGVSLSRRRQELIRPMLRSGRSQGSLCVLSTWGRRGVSLSRRRQELIRPMLRVADRKRGRSRVGGSGPPTHRDRVPGMAGYLASAPVADRKRGRSRVGGSGPPTHRDRVPGMAGYLASACVAVAASTASAADRRYRRQRRQRRHRRRWRRRRRCVAVAASTASAADRRYRRQRRQRRHRRRWRRRRRWRWRVELTRDPGHRHRRRRRRRWWRLGWLGGMGRWRWRVELTRDPGHRHRRRRRRRWWRLGWLGGMSLVGQVTGCGRLRAGVARAPRRPAAGAAVDACQQLIGWAGDGMRPLEGGGRKSPSASSSRRSRRCVPGGPSPRSAGAPRGRTDRLLAVLPRTRRDTGVTSGVRPIAEISRRPPGPHRSVACGAAPDAPGHRGDLRAVPGHGDGGCPVRRCRRRHPCRRVRRTLRCLRRCRRSRAR